MPPFTIDHWLVVALVFLLGLLIGMYAFASPKWKRRYREEVARREALEAARHGWSARDGAAAEGRPDEAHYREPLPGEPRRRFGFWRRSRHHDLSR